MLLLPGAKRCFSGMSKVSATLLFASSPLKEGTPVAKAPPLKAIFRKKFLRFDDIIIGMIGWELSFKYTRNREAKEAQPFAQNHCFAMSLVYSHQMRFV
jgi:hypothetical protein